MLRPKEVAHATSIAEAMLRASNNTYIGYDQGNRLGVTAAEILLMLNGVDPKGVECPGVYGTGLANTAKQFFGDDGMKIDAYEFLKLIA